MPYGQGRGLLLSAALSCIGKVAPRGCMRDGGKSSGVDMQVKVPNRLKLLWSKVMVVSVEEKAYKEIRQV